MVGELRGARVLFETVRHLRPGQVWGRALVPLRAEMARAAVRAVHPDGRLGQGRGVLASDDSVPHHDPWNTAEQLLAGRFTFLNHAARLGWPPRWRTRSRDLLWHFNLHYHQYLHLLPERERAAICRHWVEGNPVGAEVAWHPYVTSRRIVSWCRSLALDGELALSLWKQAEYLYRTVEWHQPGNHLLENARALVLAACTLKESPRAHAWVRRGAEILRAALEDQVLRDGVHAERSPMYHALVLEGLLDVERAIEALHDTWLRELPDLQAQVRETADSMIRYLVAATHPDGCLALLNDSTVEIAPPTEKLLRYAERLGAPLSAVTGVFQFADAGHFGFRNDRVYLLVDGGAIAPDHLPAHAHADIFTYEFDVDGRRLIVDSGVYEYAEGEMRDYVRSTRAHNTVSVDGLSQAECWKSFRVARRKAPRDVRFEAKENACIFAGRFDGYGRLIGDSIIHHRTLRLHHAAGELRVEDRVDGRGEHRVTSRIHLHPDVQVRQKGQTFTLARDRVRATVTVEGGTAILRSGWYCPEFGMRRGNKVIRLERNGPLPARLAYSIRYSRP
ncbi:MAG: heparinase II/III family protein [Acidobacteriota bacterium]